MFCYKCGNRVKDDARFCDKCGAELTYSGGEASEKERSCVEGESSLVGYSKRANDPEIIAALKKNRKAGRAFMLFIVPLPILGFVIYALVSGKMEIGSAVLYGGIISLVILLFSIFSSIRQKTEKTYDGVVTKKETHRRYRHNGDGNNTEYTEYITYVKTADGKTKKIVEASGLKLAYDYLNEGDKFRYHPGFAFPYELYNKSNAPCIYCVVCQHKNPVGADRCEKCGKPLLK